MARLLSGILCLLFIGCASSQQEERPEEIYADLVSINPPGDTAYDSSQVYVDSVKIFTRRDRPSLIIHGSFPDACTHLKSAGHTVDGNRLTMTLEAWRKPDRMCAQVLTSFTFIYEKVNKPELNGHTSISINGTEFKIQPNG